MGMQLKLTKLAVTEGNRGKNVGRGGSVLEVEQLFNAVNPGSHLDVEVGEDEVRSVGSGAVPAKLRGIDDVSCGHLSRVDERNDRQSCWQGNCILIVA